MTNNGGNIKPEEFAIKILLPHYIIEELNAQNRKVEYLDHS
jgi:hypothetical protein